MMKKAICIILSLSMICMLTGCLKSRKTADTVIDYGESERFSLEDRKTAVHLILNEIEGWQGVRTLHNVRYGGDEASLAEQGYGGCDEVMIFYSDFKTVSNSSKAGGFNLDMEYTDWNWILGKDASGQWKLLTWGY